MQVNNSFFMRAIILLSNVPIHLCHILRKIRLVKCYTWQTVRIFGIIVQHSFIQQYSLFNECFQQQTIENLFTTRMYVMQGESALTPPFNLVLCWDHVV